MAPEYLVRGQLTEKADVYSFGVLVLEILTRRKNGMITKGLCSVLQSVSFGFHFTAEMPMSLYFDVINEFILLCQVWRDYKSNCLHESVDPALGGDFPVMEATKVLQIGLLCTQASAELRPSMPQVVEMLNDKQCPVPAPEQPPFLNAGMLSSDNSTRSSSTGFSNRLSNISSTYTMRSSITGTPPSEGLALEVSKPW